MDFKVWDKKHPTDLGKVPTGEIIHRIQQDPQQFQERYLDTVGELQFEEYLSELMEKYHFTPGKLIIRSCLSKPFVYQILKGERVPGRDMVIRMGLAMSAELDEIQRLLTRAGKGVLYPKVRRDAAIMCCIEMEKTLEDTNLFLKEHGEKELM